MIHETLPHSPRRGRRVVTGLAAAATATFLAFGASAGPAFADTPLNGGAKGSYVGNGQGGEQVTTSEGRFRTNLFRLRLEDGTELLTYCIDVKTGIRNGANYVEDAWETYPGQGQFAEPARVHWILQNSYPTLDEAALGEAAGIQGLTAEQAVAGTQAAIWHFSNEIDLQGNNNPNVQALYDYLVENAQELPQTAEPDASLSITPESAEGRAGETIGEFTVSTSAESLPLSLEGPEGVQLVDLETGEPVEAVGNGDSFGVQVPADAAPGEASVSGSVTAEVHTGRLFRGAPGEDATQTLITAEGDEAEINAGVRVSWTEGVPEESPSPSPSETPSPSPSAPESPAPSPTPSTPDEQTPPTTPPSPGGGLPVTGAALGGLIAVAAVAIGGGGAAMYLARKRKSGQPDDAAQ
ncbi:thioester domain-containing protein [Marinactinospora rubrisoli]|uniref:Thioester domain-containing protein n=1 Tax=Marinactinospora rubrisoli TaxID=2715399 RepID=A0ABW2KCM2_9ACTN